MGSVPCALYIITMYILSLNHSFLFGIIPILLKEFIHNKPVSLNWFLNDLRRTNSFNCLLGISPVAFFISFAAQYLMKSLH